METVEEFRKALVGCKKRSDGTRAIELLREMEGRGLGPGAREYTACIVACGWAGRCGDALDLFAEMPAHGVAPDEFVYAAAIGACARDDADRQRGCEHAIALMDAAASLWHPRDLAWCLAAGDAPRGAAAPLAVQTSAGPGRADGPSRGHPPVPICDASRL